MTRTRWRQKYDERGIAMMLCLFALLLLTSIAMGLMFMSNTETTVNSSYRLSTQAYYSSKAGIEEARERMRYVPPPPPPAISPYVPPPAGLPSSSNPAGIRYILNTTDATNDPVAPWDSGNPYFDDELCSEPLYDSTPAVLVPTLYGVPCPSGPPAGSYTSYPSTDLHAMGYKWVRITPKQNCTEDYGVDGTVRYDCTGGANRARLVCADIAGGTPVEKLATGTNCESSGLSPVYVITSMAASKKGPKRITQAEVAALGAGLTQIAGALTLAGTPSTVSPNNDLHFPTSATNRINGNDHGSGCNTTSGKFGIVTTAGAAPPVRTFLGLTSYQALGTGYSAAPYVPSLSGTDLGSVFGTVGGLQKLVTQTQGLADQTFGSTSDVALGTDDSPLITVINGDFTMGSAHGAGLLLVTGALYVRGNPDFNGLILVIGKGQMYMNIVMNSMPNTGSMNGGILVANLYDSSNILLPSSSAPGRPKFSWNDNGVFDINYDSCWIGRMASRFGYTVLAEREKTY